MKENKADIIFYAYYVSERKNIKYYHSILINNIFHFFKSIRRIKIFEEK
jgi:hypothetical protein